MRVESDRQDHHRSDAPACHRCGVPLLDETTFCPFCERWLDDAGEPQPRRTDIYAAEGRRGLRVSEQAVLTVGFVFFTVVAAACLIVALVVA